MIKQFMRVMIILVFVLGFHPVSANLSAPEQNDFWIDVIHNTDMVVVYGFNAGYPLIFRFYESTSSIEPFYSLTMPTFGSGNYHLFGFQHKQDLVPGNVVEVIDGMSYVNKELEILNLIVDPPNYGSSEITGTGPEGEVVSVSVTDDESINFTKSKTVSPDGTWNVDFSEEDPQFKLSQNLYIEASIDEPIDDLDGGGDRTRYDISAVNPSMEAYYSIDSVSVYNYSPNAFVRLEVNDGTDLLFGPVTAVTDGEGSTSIDLWRYGYDLGTDVYIQLGDISTGIKNSMKVERFTGYEDFSDPNNKRLYGELPTDWPQNFSIEIGEAGLPVYHVSVEPNPDGTWEYPLDNKEIEGWTAFLYDGNGNATMVSKPDDPSDVPPSHFILVDINGNIITPTNFGRNADVQISLYQTESDAVPLKSWDVTLDSDGRFSLDTDEVVPPIDLVHEMRVHVKDDVYGSTEREHVLDMISVTNFDPDTNQINGITSSDMSGSTFNMRVYLVSGDYHNVTIEVKDGGTWEYQLDPSWEIDRISIWLREFVGDDVTAFVLNSDSFIREVGTSGSSLTVEDDQGDSTIINIPEDAVDETISLSYTPQDAISAPDGFSFAGSSFDLTASQNGEVLEDYVFQVPVRITLEYSDEDIIYQDEDSLTLYYWDENGQMWVDAATTCEPISVYNRYPAENYIEVDICHLSRFSLIGENLFTIFLPGIIDRK
jgi:hypothetical protein